MRARYRQDFAHQSVSGFCGPPSGRAMSPAVAGTAAPSWAPNMRRHCKNVSVFAWRSVAPFCTRGLSFRHPLLPKLYYCYRPSTSWLTRTHAINKANAQCTRSFSLSWCSTSPLINPMLIGYHWAVSTPLLKNAAKTWGTRRATPAIWSTASMRRTHAPQYRKDAWLICQERFSLLPSLHRRGRRDPHSRTSFAPACHVGHFALLIAPCGRA